MKQIKKRLLSMLLTLAMLLTLLPTSLAFNVGEETHSIQLSVSGRTVTATAAESINTQQICLIGWPSTYSISADDQVYATIQGAINGTGIYDASTGSEISGANKLLAAKDTGEATITLPDTAETGEWTIKAYSESMSANVNTQTATLTADGFAEPLSIAAETVSSSLKVGVALTSDVKLATITGGTAPYTLTSAASYGGLSIAVEGDAVYLKKGTPTTKTAANGSFAVTVQDGDTNSATATVSMPEVAEGVQTLTRTDANGNTITVGNTLQLAFSSTAAADSPTITYAYESGNGSVTSGGLVSITGGATSGTIVVNVNSAATANYAAATQVQVTLTISQGQTNTVAFATTPDATVTYGDTGVSAPSINATAGADSVKYESSDTSVATINEDTGAITLLKNGKTNITATVPAGTYGGVQYAEGKVSYELTVNQKTLTVADGTYAVAKDYDGGTSVGTATGALALNGVVSGDTVTVSGTVGTYADATVGENKTITVTSLTLADTDAGKYKLDDALASGYVFTKAKINKKAVTLTTTARKSFDGSDAVNLADLAKNSFGHSDVNDIVSGETITITALTGAKYNSAGVHGATALAATGAPTYNDAASNYDITLTITTGEIAKATPAFTVEETELAITKAKAEGYTIKVNGLDMAKAGLTKASAAGTPEADKYAVRYWIETPAHFDVSKHDCATLNTTAHKTTCDLVTTSGTSTCNCGATSVSEYDEAHQHESGCTYNTGSGNCDCKIALNAPQDQHDSGCAANVAETKAWVASELATAYLRDLQVNDVVYINICLPGTNTNFDTLAFNGGGDTNHDNATASFKVVSDPATGGGGGGTTSYKVSFDAGSNGKISSGSASVYVNSGAKIAESKIPSITANDGYKFLGWSLDGKTVVNPADAKVTKAVTYTALYEKTGEPVQPSAEGFVKDRTASYMNGYPDGTFRPQAGITRGEVAAVIARTILPEFPTDSVNTPSYNDLSGHWAAKYIGYLESLGVVTGYPDGSYKPDQTITRSEFVAIVIRVDGLVNGSNTFSDVSDSNWATKYIVAAVEKAYVSGYPDGTFRPEQSITRTEAAKIMNAVLGWADKTADGQMNFSDVATDFWGWNDILKAANGVEA